MKKINEFNKNSKKIQQVILVVAHLLTFNILFINLVFSQCDPSTIDLCEIGKNSVIQASYHAQIIKTSNGYSITGQDFAPNGSSDQAVLSNIPSTQYPMPTGIFPVWGAIGGRTQAVFIGSDSKIYAVGSQNLLIHNANTSGTAWGETSLSLPSGITVCDINKWEGSAGSGGGGNNDNITGERDGFLAFSTLSGDVYVTGQGATYVQFQASNTDWSKIDLPVGIRVVDFAVGHQTLLVLGNDGNFYASGSTTYLGNGTSVDLNILTLLENQPAISTSGITQIEAGYRSYLVLDGDGTIHVLGENSVGNLGVNHNNDLSVWSKVGSGCPDGPLNNVAYISTLSSHDNRSSSSAILVDGTIRSWGENDKQSIDAGADRIITCPVTPMGTNRNAVAISNGGHITPYVNTNIQICNIGHNRQGAFGDGNSDGGDYGAYTCINIPGMPEVCGTKEVDLELVKTVNEVNPIMNDTIVFAITITNKGPGVSTGSTVRDQLMTGFEYISDDANGAYNSSTGLWRVGPLEAEESVSLNLSVVALASGDHFNYAQILSDSEVDPDSTPGDKSTNQDDDDTIRIRVDPMVVCSDITIDLNADGIASATVNDFFLSDVVDCTHFDSLIIEYDSPLSFDCSDAGINEIVFTIMDKCRNTTTCISTITVQSYRVIEEVLVCPEDSIFIGNNWIHPPNVHIDTFTKPFGCDSLHVTNIQHVEEPPIPRVRMDCEELAVVLNIDPQSTWYPSWDNGETTHETRYESTMLQANLTLNTAPNCEEQLTISIPPIPNLNDIPLIEDTTIIENNAISIALDLNTEEWQMNWDPVSIVDCDSCMQVNITAIESTNVSMYLEHISGCLYESSFFISVKPEPELLYVPNVFSPNRDSRNDEWTVFHSPNLQITACSIFNRWGNLVYHSTTDQPKWNGKYQGEDCMQGVYMYVLTYSNGKGISKIKSGDLTLIK